MNDVKRLNVSKEHLFRACDMCGGVDVVLASDYDALETAYNVRNDEVTGLAAQRDALAAEVVRLAEKYNAVVIRDNEHCKDCCCARSWKSLGVDTYTGLSIPEHIAKLRQFKEWAEPQIIHYGEQQLEIERLREALRQLTYRSTETGQLLSIKADVTAWVGPLLDEPSVQPSEGRT